MLCKANGNIFLLSELAIDGNAYHPSRSTRTIENVTVYPNNYKYSNIRAWLNETFYETAFNNEQKSLILTTNVDNSARSTNPNDNATLWNGGVNNYACEDTQDKVFLLSVQEATNSVYGFRADPDSYDLAKCKKITDYGKAKGVFVNRESDYYGQVSWRLRSPYFQSENFPRYNNTFGYVGLSYEVTYTDFGIVPAMWIRPE